MDTAAFFKKILPREGLKLLAELVPYKDKTSGKTLEGWRYTTYGNFDAMAEAVAQFESQNRTVYHACNSYGDWYLDPSKNKKRIRTQANVVACRSLYDDIDVAKPGAYADTKEAMAAVREFIATTHMPTPLVIYSGGGIHLYWPLAEDVTPDEWQELSALKRRVTRHLKLRVDPACDIDSARVLRPVGSTNKKYGDPIPVLAKNAPAESSAAEIRAVLEAYCEANDVPELALGKSKLANAFGAALDTDYPDSFADTVAQHCNVIRWFKDTGAPEEPIWHKCVGTLKHCVDGEEKIHAWSAAYEGYDAGETQQKIDGWTYGPATCEAFRQIADSHCAGCTQKCKTPVQLGYSEVAAPPSIADAVQELQERAEEKKYHQAMTEEELIETVWPARFAKLDGKLARMFVDPDSGVVTPVRFCDTIFYPVWLQERENTAEGFNILIEYLTKSGAKRRFEIPADALSSSDKLSSALAAHTVWINEGKGMAAHGREYVKQFAANLQEYRREVETHKAFGWVGNHQGFVIGNRMITAEGEVPVMMATSVHSAEMAKDYGVNGSIENWKRLVNEIYNRPGAEAYQFAFLASAAAPLVSMVNINGFHGIPIAFTGDKGAQGKTTTCRMACGIWGYGDWFLKDSGKEGATQRSLTQRIAIARHVPWIMDEITTMEPKDIGGLCYSLSNGQEKDRLNTSGNFASGTKRWDTVTFLTANKDLNSLLLSLDRQSSDAMAVRVFEIKLDANFNDRTFGGSNAKTLIEEELVHEYGHVGRELIRYYMQNHDKVVRKFMSLRRAYNPRSAEETRERFYNDLICIALTAGAVMKHLGLVEFDLDAIRKWAFEVVVSLREGRLESAKSEEDHISQFLSSLQGRTIVTKHYGDGRMHKEQPLDIVRNEAVARHAIVDKRFFVSASEIKNWCREQQLSPTQFVRTMDAYGYIHHEEGRSGTGSLKMRLGTGTDTVTGVAACYELNYSKLFGEAAQTDAKVVKLR